MTRTPSVAEARRRAQGARERQEVQVGSGPETIRAIQDLINEGKLPQVYVADGRLVHIEEVSGAAAAVTGEEDSPLPVTASELDRHLLASLLARCTKTYQLKSRPGAKGHAASTIEEEVTPSPQILTAALAPKTWPRLLPYRGMAGAPLLRPDGTLLQKPGYDQATGLYLASKVSLDPVPDRPTARQVESAQAFFLDQFLRDFCWVGEADRANYLAVLATPILRWYLRTLIPFVVFTATMPSSGKTILTSGPGLLYGQRVLTWPDGNDADNELRKVITSVLADPVGAVIFDNLAEGTVIKSPVLARLLTERNWADRLLGGNATANYANDRLWCATGNNLRLGGDMVTRTVLIALDPNTPHPEERGADFAIPGLDQWILDPANQRKVLWHLLILILDWINNEAPRDETLTMRQFTPWARALGGFLNHHGIKRFLGNTESTRNIDEDSAIWEAFLAKFHELHDSAWLTTHELHADADTPPGQLDKWDGLFITDGRGRLPAEISLGRRLGGQVGRWRNSYVLRCAKDSHTKTNRWRVETTPE
jgi:hypothetical protein